jgi:hypothetical protein
VVRPRLDLAKDLPGNVLPLGEPGGSDLGEREELLPGPEEVPGSGRMQGGLKVSLKGIGLDLDSTEKKRTQGRRKNREPEALARRLVLFRGGGFSEGQEDSYQNCQRAVFQVPDNHSVDPESHQSRYHPDSHGLWTIHENQIVPEIENPEQSEGDQPQEPKFDSYLERIVVGVVGTRKLGVVGGHADSLS